MEVSQRFHIPLPEDAAEAPGSFYKGHHTGHYTMMSALNVNGNIDSELDFTICESLLAGAQACRIA